MDPEIRKRLEAAGRANDEAFDLFGTALALAALDRPRVGLDWYEDHARQLVAATREALAGLEAAGFEGGPAEQLRTALSSTLAGAFGYVGDRLNYDDLQNANLMRVMDRRKGLPVALGILYIHVGRALGFRVEGLGLPGHFLIRAEAGGERVIFDPFNAGVAVATAEMRELLKATLGVSEELTPEHWSAVTDRSVVMRLQNNIKVRRLRAEAFTEALKTVEGMLLIAPDEASLWREAGILRAREGHVGSAIDALEHYLALAPADELRHQTAVLLQQLRPGSVEPRRPDARKAHAPMTLAVAIQMDPIERVNIDADSTFAMALEAQGRGCTLWHYLPSALSFRDGKLTARAHPLSVRAVKGDHYALGAPQGLDLSTVDVILLRQDPPFDMSYITSTHLLEHVAGPVLVVNEPAEVRNAPEKIFVTRFPELMPPTLITSDRAEIEAFRREHRDIIVKPLFGNGGAGVFHLKPDDENLGALLETFTQLYREPIIVQRYLPEIRQGDKRIILVEGEPVGAVSRIPLEGEARANFHAGGAARKTTLTTRERQICEAIGPTLREKGLVFVGIDVIGDWLTEINVTSPTGIHEINRLDGVRIQATLWDAIEARAAGRRKDVKAQKGL